MKISTIHTGRFKLDGGAMFGVVPKRVWTRFNQADENNMCTWSMRSMLIETGEKKILIDTGIGNKQDERFMSFFEPHGEDSIDTSLLKMGLFREDITDVFLTHLHFDHVGGAIRKNSQGEAEIAFPNATYWSNELQYNSASDPNPRERASFLKENFTPLADQGVLRFVDVEQDVPFLDGIKLKFVYGHTEAMMLPIIQIDDQHSIAFVTDLIPSHGHIGLPYVMSYDIRPLTTMQEKQDFYEEALANNYLVFFQHDKDHDCCSLKRDQRGRVVIDRIMSLADAISID